MASKKSSKKSFKDLVNVKKKIDIKDNEGNVLFSLEGLNSKQFEEFKEITKFKKSEENKDVAIISDEYIVWLLRKMVKGDIDIESLTDEEVVETISNLDLEMKNQIESALEELIVKNLHIEIDKIKKLQQSLIDSGLVK